MRPDSLLRFWCYINWYLLTYLRMVGCTVVLGKNYLRNAFMPVYLQAA